MAGVQRIQKWNVLCTAAKEVSTEGVLLHACGGTY
jgi:hypothetical protein